MAVHSGKMSPNSKRVAIYVVAAASLWLMVSGPHLLLRFAGAAVCALCLVLAWSDFAKIVRVYQKRTGERRMLGFVMTIFPVVISALLFITGAVRFSGDFDQDVWPGFVGMIGFWGIISLIPDVPKHTQS